MPALKEWQQRPLKNICPVMRMVAVHYKITEAGRYIGKAIYTLSGLIPEEKKELPGL
ncbi:hypothetical protein C8R11_1066 [Nitrosomonas aestuarii]|nr:hypothetical protein C8R11_1066 [Nitrosomonas aestuarii]